MGGTSQLSPKNIKMSANGLEVVKDKVKGVLAKYPVIDEPLTKLAEKAKVDKVFIAFGIALVPILLFCYLGSAHFIM